MKTKYFIYHDVRIMPREVSLKKLDMNNLLLDGEPGDVVRRYLVGDGNHHPLGHSGWASEPAKSKLFDSFNEAKKVLCRVSIRMPARFKIGEAQVG